MSLTTFQNTGKTVGFIIFLILVLVVTIFLGKNASGLLTARASTCPAQNVQAVQVTSNAAVINWTTQNPSQGMVEYGTDPASLTFSKIEASEGTTHNVPLVGNTDDLVPDTTYFYLVKINNVKCDSTGQACTDKCVPWYFKTTGININPTTVVLVSPVSASDSATPTVSTEKPVMSDKCIQVEKNMGASDKSPNWAQIKQYDLDGNKLINTRDLNMCLAEKK